jgi:hypothetical protein
MTQIRSKQINLGEAFDFAGASGVVDVTTQTPGDNSTKSASTAYVDAAVGATSDNAIADPVYTVFDSQIALSGEKTGDGKLTALSRVLVIGQTDPIENGIYVTAAGAWARASDMPAAFAAGGMLVVVEDGGTEYANAIFTVEEAAGSDVVGTDGLTIARKDAQLDGSTLARGSTGLVAVQADSIDNTLLANMAANTVKVRDANSSGDPSDKAVADTQILIGNGAGFTAAALSGDATMANTGAVTIANNAISNAKLADMAANTVKVRDAGTSGDPSDLSVADTQIVIGNGAGFTAAALSGDVTMANTGAVTIAGDAVDNTKLANMAANTVKVRDAGTSGDPSDKAVADTQILIGNGAGFTAAALSGEVTMTNAGVVTIASFSLSPDNAQIVGTPDSANDGINKAALDAAIAGVSWKNPAAVLQLVGNATIATINGLSPTAGDAYVATDAGTPTAGTSDALVAGSIAEFDGTSWIEIVAGSGGFVPDGTRAILATQTALISPYTDATDDGKVVDFDGTTLTGADTSEAVDGNGILINGNGGFYENCAHVFSGVVATGSWIQFGGPGSAAAGAGMSAAGFVLNVGDVNRGVQVNADDLEIDANEIAGDGLKQAANTWQLDIEPADFAGNGLEDDGSDNLRLATTVTITYDDAAGTVVTYPVTTTGQGLFVDGDPVDNLHVAPKQYVDGAVEGVKAQIKWLTPVHARANGNVNLAAPGATIDGVGLTTGDRFAAFDQSTGSQDGIYIYQGAATPATRAGDMPASSTAFGINFYVAAGATYGDMHFAVTSGPGSDTIGTDALAVQLMGPYTASGGINISSAGAVSVDAVKEEITTQVITGTDTAITDTLASTPATGTLNLYLNGVHQVEGAGKDYTVSGTTITWLASSGTAVDMDGSDVLEAKYLAA